MPLGERAGNMTTTAEKTHSSPRAPGTRSDDHLTLPRTRQPVTDVSNMMPYHNPKDKSEYKHGDFSFESPPDSPEPDLVLIPNKGGLEIKSTHGTITHSGGSDDLEPDDPQVRSTSSSYPSVGMRSPSLTVSPPMTFGRRILSSLEAYGFSNAHLSFLQSTDSSSTRLPGGSDEIPQPEMADNHIWDYLAAKRDESAVPDIHHEKEKPGIDPADCKTSTNNLVRSLSANDQSKASKEALPPSNTYPQRRKEPRSTTISTTHRFQSSADVQNLSTQCLPRVSDGPEARPSFSDAPRVDHCSQASRRSDGLEESDHSKPSSSHRDRRPSLRHRITHYFQLRKTVKVKKWIVKKFRAGRKGSKVVVRKVKEHRAKFVGSGKPKGTRLKSEKGDSAVLFHGGFHGRGGENDKKRANLTRSIRKFGVTLFGTVGENGRGGRGGEHGQGHGTVSKTELVRSG